MEDGLAGEIKPRRAVASQVSWVFRFLSTAALVVSIIALCFSVGSNQPPPTPAADKDIGFIPGRLNPGDDIITGLMAIVRARRLQSAWVTTGVGGLATYNIRFANQPTGSSGSGYFEIVSLGGTLTSNSPAGAASPSQGAWHLHISVSDTTGRTIGGHLLENSTVFGTLEFVIGYDCSLVFTRAVVPPNPNVVLNVAQQRWC